MTWNELQGIMSMIHVIRQKDVQEILSQMARDLYRVSEENKKLNEEIERLKNFYKW